MAQVILMPKAGISVESCIMGAWRVNPGSSINIGDILFDYETDKAAFECESTAEGTLLDVFFEPGDEVPCLTAVCAIGQPGEDTSSLRPSNSIAAVSEKSAETKPHISNPQSPEANNSVVQNENSEPTGAASPRAKSLAKRMKIDLNAATPTGPRGRIIERDVLTAAKSGYDDGIGGRGGDGYIGGGTSQIVSIDKTAGKAEYTDEKMTPIRKAIAKSMSKSLTEIAQLTHHHSCDAAVVLELRQRFKKSGGRLGLDGITIGDMMLYATVLTLRDHPNLNAHLLNNDTLRKFGGVHLGVAVDTPRGLLVPTIFDADRMSLSQLSTALKELAAQAKSGSISPDLLTGASFTVSNLGALGVEMFTPVINPPQVAILGVCGTITRIREFEGNLAAYQSMGLSLTYDHRAIDGADASRFAQDLSKNIENLDLLLAL